MSVTEVVGWAEQHGAQINAHVGFVDTETSGVSAVLKEDCKLTKDEELIRVPKKLFITPALAESYFQIKLGDKANRTCLAQLLLAKLRFDSQDTVLEGENLSQFYSSYVNFLPSAQKTGSPLFWGYNERQLIKGTELANSLDSRVKNLIVEWYSLVKKLPAEHQNSTDLMFYDTFMAEPQSEKFISYFTSEIKSWTSFPAYLWSFIIFNSRAFPYFLVDSKNAHDLNEAFLLPVVDLLNHSNDAKVHWESKDGDFVFKTEQELKSKGAEVFNNYGEKSNEELLFGYGFVVDNNKYDYLKLSLRIPQISSEMLKRFRINIKPNSSNEVSFRLSCGEPLPADLIQLFAYLVKTPDEKETTLRNKLEGLQQLSNIIKQKLELLKKPVIVNDTVDAKYLKISKSYKNSSKLIYQAAFENITSLEKSLIKQYKPLSFKTLFKNDTVFKNSLLLTFGISTYEQLAKSNDIDNALLLWFMRLKNHKQFGQDNLFPNWIITKLDKIEKSYKISESDVKEFIPFYKSLFPILSDKIPEIYSKGKWDIKTMIFCNELKNEISFKREANNEIFLIDDVVVDDTVEK